MTFAITYGIICTQRIPSPLNNLLWEGKTSDMLILVLISILYAIACFCLQTFLLGRYSKGRVHAVPLIIVGIVYLAAISLPLLDLYMRSVGLNDGYSFCSFVAACTAGVNTVGLCSIGLAWLINKV